MNYWIVKANPTLAGLPFNELFRSGRGEDWRAKRIPKTFAKGDRVVFWQSGSGFRVIALGEVVNPFVGREEKKEKKFILRTLTKVLPKGPDITLLRKVPIFKNASFLKAGYHGTIFDLTMDQGSWLHGRLIQQNPTISGIWPNLTSDAPMPDIESEILSIREGRQFLVTHLRRERSPELVAQKKAAFLAKHGHFFCEACNTDLRSVYGEAASGAYEAHHRSLLSRAHKGGVITSTADLAILCANCHRIIHRCDPPISVAKFSAKLLQHSKQERKLPG